MPFQANFLISFFIDSIPDTKQAINTTFPKQAFFLAKCIIVLGINISKVSERSKNNTLQLLLLFPYVNILLLITSANWN